MQRRRKQSGRKSSSTSTSQSNSQSNKTSSTAIGRDPVGAHREQAAYLRLAGPSKFKFQRKVRAPNLDEAALEASVQFRDMFKASRRDQKQRETDMNFLLNCLQRLGRNASSIASYLWTKYSGKTAAGYVRRWQEQVPGLKLWPEWNIACKKLLQFCEERPAEGARPATFQQVRQLIGDLSTPEQIMCYQLWSTASRHRESMPQITEDNRYIRPRVWEFSLWTPDNIVSMHLRTHKGATRAQRPYSKWVRAAPGHLEKGVWRRHRVTYQKAMIYIKSVLGDEYSTYSLRKGAINLLENFASPSDVARLAGHSELGRIKSLARSYTARMPSHADAQKCLELTDLLQEAVLRPAAFRKRLATTKQQKKHVPTMPNSVKKRSKRAQAPRRR